MGSAKEDGRKKDGFPQPFPGVGPQAHEGIENETSTWYFLQGAGGQGIDGDGEGFWVMTLPLAGNGSTTSGQNYFATPTIHDRSSLVPMMAAIDVSLRRISCPAVRNSAPNWIGRAR